MINITWVLSHSTLIHTYSFCVPVANGWLRWHGLDESPLTGDWCGKLSTGCGEMAEELSRVWNVQTENSCGAPCSKERLLEGGLQKPSDRLSASDDEKPGRTTEEDVTANGSQTVAAQWERAGWGLQRRRLCHLLCWWRVIELGFENELWKQERADERGGPGYWDRRKKMGAELSQLQQCQERDVGYKWSCKIQGRWEMDVEWGQGWRMPD